LEGKRDFMPLWVLAQETALPKRNKFDSAPAPLKDRTFTQFKKRVAKQKRHRKEDLCYIWYIFLKKTGELVGFMDINTISRDPHQMANLGYFIFNTCRGQGYGVEAIRKLIAAAFIAVPEMFK
jgi:ribosomal-protein-alanine N-acetyltransferase